MKAKLQITLMWMPLQKGLKIDKWNIDALRVLCTLFYRQKSRRELSQQ